jgi:hypothetical protein
MGAMGRMIVGHWADRAAELAGASALAVGCGASAYLLRPFAALAEVAMVVASALTGGLLGWLFVSRTGSATAAGTLVPFDLATIHVDEDVQDDGELLLDQPITVPAMSSRVISLFGGGELLPTAGELQRRIDRHLGSTSAPETLGPHEVPDASDALFEALAGLRRSLRRR